MKACDAMPRDPAIRRQLAGFYNRQGHFDKTMEALHAATELENANPRAHQLEATYYWEKAYRDHRLPKELRLEYMQKGIEAADRALALAPDYVDALSFKNLLLRLRANDETDAAIRSALIVDADALRERAIELSRQRTIAGGSRGTVESLPGGPPPPPLPPPRLMVDGVTPARVGGAVRAPTKLVDVKPVYPDDARRANVQGVVIIEIVIDTEGRVRDARILRSIPLLDDAALEAVRQWEFTPTAMDGVPVPLAMTVTVNFSR
jgi:TonB family protein